MVGDGWLVQHRHEYIHYWNVEISMYELTQIEQTSPNIRLAKTLKRRALVDNPAKIYIIVAYLVGVQIIQNRNHFSSNLYEKLENAMLGMMSKCVTTCNWARSLTQKKGHKRANHFMWSILETINIKLTHFAMNWFFLSWLRNQRKKKAFFVQLGYDHAKW